MNAFKIENSIILELEAKDINLNDQSYYWVIANNSEIDLIRDTFELKLETIKECDENKLDTRIEVYPKYNSCVFNEIRIEKQLIRIEKMDIYYSANYIVCISKGQVEAYERVLQKLKANDNNLLINTKNPCNKILYLIMDDIFNSYLDTIIQFEKRIETFEEKVLHNKFKNFLIDFIPIRRQVLKLIRYISPLSYLIDIIRLNENKSIDNEMLRYFDNLDIKFEKLNNNIIGLKESAAYLREAYEAEVSNKSNNIMMIFAIVSAIFLPLTLLTGIFGMNFTRMPWIGNPNGFHQLMIFMGLVVLTSIGMLVLFKKRNLI